MHDLMSQYGWRIALVLSGLIALIGGPQHPDSDAKDPLREELAVMTADPAWVPSHALLLVSVGLLTVGLVAVRREPGWPASAGSALRVAGAAMVLYTIEAAFHLAAVIDSDRLAAGEFAPIAFTHIALATVLYPVSGLAILFLAWKLLPTWTLPQRVFAVAGMVGGLLHATALPTTLLFSETETSPMFAFAALLIAVWSIAVGLVGLRSWRREAAPSLAGAAA